MEGDMDIATRKNFLGLPAYESEEDEVYMNERQLAYFEHVLTVWVQHIINDFDDFKHGLRVGDVCVDEMDKASHEETQRIGLRSTERKSKLLRKVSSTLNRLRKGDFGYCKTCGVPIGFARLEARPTAEQCINCKTISELYEQRGKV